MNHEEEVLNASPYPDLQDWRKFASLMLLTLGAGFTIAGIIFFFAYNWDELHKFFKFVLIGGLLIASCLMAFIRDINTLPGKILLTATAVLTGVLFAVYGQVYQTGADAYDFFLAWSVFITLWVFIAKFPPLWVIYLLLINTTIILYDQQVANKWPFLLLYLIIFLLNTGVLVVCKFLSKSGRTIPVWFTNLLALTAIGSATTGIIIGIMESPDSLFWILLIITIVLYAAGFLYSQQKKSLFYISVIVFSVITIISAWILRYGDGAGGFLVAAVFIIGTVTLTIQYLLTQQKKWNNE